MKKLFISIISLIIITGCAIFIAFKNNDDSGLTKVRVAEVTHSVFYAPQYVAHALGYFEELGLDVEITLTPGADKVTAAVLSNSADIGFCGSEATIYVYNGGEKDYLVNFAGLTKRDGSFLVSRNKIDNFKLEMVNGKYIIGGRPGGMPLMTLRYSLENNGIDLDNVTIDTSIEFASMAGAFIGGTGDFVTLFEPQALEVEKNGYGYVVASIGNLSGVVPYTAYNARLSYINDNPDVITKFTDAIQKGLDYVHNNSEEDIAKVITSYFPDTSLVDLEKIVKRYKDNDSWFTTTYISEDNFNHIQNIMVKNNQLDKYVPYSDLVTTKYSKKTN
ncbi:MAG: ABC transporter substrate-binding protein [Bacilli bacterium]|nr:ABC transporter substrate-binding protein [Bacilli bacterium]